MTIFDLIALAVLGLSAIAGANRGAVRELLGLFALALSAMATIAFLPVTARLARHALHAGWLSAVAAAVITFVAVFLVLRLIASTITRSLDRSFLSGPNRFGGLLFGALRGVVLLGLFTLVFDKATPQTLKPDWITNAMSYPPLERAGRAVQGLIPHTFDPAGGFGGALANSIVTESRQPDDETMIREQPSDDGATSETPSNDAPASSPAPGPSAPPQNLPTSERAKPQLHGYTRRARDSVDALVERSK